MKPPERIAFLVSAALFFTCFTVFNLSPVVDNADSRYSIVLSESILHHLTSHLNDYRFPGPVANLKTSTPPILDPENPATYQLGRVNGNVVYCFPNGSSILSLPFVAILNSLSVHAADSDGTYNQLGELLIEKLLAALLMAAFVCILFRTALLISNLEVSLLLALGLAFGTQVWSTATRSLWSHTWLIVLGGLAVATLFRSEVFKRKLPAVYLATILSWMYFVRPTGAIPIVCVTIYLVACHRSEVARFATTGALWLGGFIAYSWFTFGEILPGYYLASRLQFSNWPIALIGILISPSRGFLVYVPTITFVAYLLVRYWSQIPYRRLVCLSFAIVLLQVVCISGYPNWWGGGSYGPRLMTDTLPWLALLAILGCAGAATKRNQVLSRPEFAFAAMLLAISVAINARGAFSVYAHHVWNLEMEIDHHPERAFDWSYPQFVTGLIKPPDYVTWRFPVQPSKTHRDLALSAAESSLTPATARRGASR